MVVRQIMDAAGALIAAITHIRLNAREGIYGDARFAAILSGSFFARVLPEACADPRLPYSEDLRTWYALAAPLDAVIP